MSKFLKDVLSNEEDVDLSQEINRDMGVDEESLPAEESEEEVETEEVPDEDQNLEDEDDSDDDDGEEEAEESDEDDDEDDPEEDEPSALEEQMAKLEKRVEDNQKYSQQVANENALLKKENAELKEKAEQDSDDAWMDNEDVDDPVKEQFKKYEARLSTMEKERQEERSAANLKLWEAQAAPFREKHSDFDEMVKVLEDGYTEEIKKEFVAAGSSHDAAYKIGKRMHLVKMQTEDPEKYALYLKDLQTKKAKGKKKKTKKIVSDITGGSKTPRVGEKKKTEERSLVKSLFS